MIGGSFEIKVDIPLQLLGDIFVRLHELLHDVDIPLSLMAENGGLLKKGSTNAGGSIDELLSEFLQRWKAASQVVETTSDSTLSTAFLVQEINKRLLATATGVGKRVLLVFTALSEELDGREGADAIHHSDGLVVTGVGIHVGEDAVLLTLEVLCDLLVDGLHGLAVTTPGSSECDENIFGFVQRDGVEIVNGEGRDLGWRRRFDVGFNASLVSDAVRGLLRAGEWMTEGTHYWTKSSNSRPPS